jgi:uncharacterized membrane protein YecN with MAPEG domain
MHCDILDQTYRIDWTKFHAGPAFRAFTLIYAEDGITQLQRVRRAYANAAAAVTALRPVDVYFACHFFIYYVAVI